MLVRAKLLLKHEGDDGGCEGEVFHVLVNPTTKEVHRPARLTSLALEVIRKEGKTASSENLSKMLLALRSSSDGEREDRRAADAGRAPDAGLACSCELSERCAMRVGNAVQLPSRDPASRVVYGRACFCVEDALMDSGLPVVQVQHTLGCGKTLSLFAIFMKAPADVMVAKHTDSVMHFVRRGAGPCVSVQALRLGRRSSSCILRNPFQSNFHSREQLSESHAAELQNLGLDCGAVQHAITPLWTASQSAAERGGERVAFLSLRI
jgi:hypothetical protein